MPQSYLTLGGIEKMIVGMTEQQAMRTLKINGFDGRVVSRDGKCLTGTCDIREDRISLTIVNGKVVGAIVG